MISMMPAISTLNPIRRSHELMNTSPSGRPRSHACPGGAAAFWCEARAMNKKGSLPAEERSGQGRVAEKGPPESVSRRQRLIGVGGRSVNREDFQKVALDGRAEPVQPQIVLVKAEGIFDLDSDLLDPEQDIADQQDDRDRPPGEQVEQGE